MQYICEHCGKITNIKYGSGRFCSRSCANSRPQTECINKKRSDTLKHKKPRKKILLRCKVCGKEFLAPFNKKGLQNRYVKTCSKECLTILKRKNSLGNNGGGFREGSAKNYKHGTYKDIKCDSS